MLRSQLVVDLGRGRHPAIEVVTNPQRVSDPSIGPLPGVANATQMKPSLV